MRGNGLLSAVTGSAEVPKKGGAAEAVAAGPQLAELIRGVLLTGLDRRLPSKSPGFKGASETETLKPTG